MHSPESHRPRVAIVSLGCAKNLVDSEQIASLLEAAGVEVCADPATAPVAIVNTCGFIESAKEQSIETILEACRLKEEGRAVDCPVYDRYALCAGDALDGPAVVEEMDASTVVPGGFSARLDDYGNLVMTRN